MAKGLEPAMRGGAEERVGERGAKLLSTVAMMLQALSKACSSISNMLLGSELPPSAWDGTAIYILCAQIETGQGKNVPVPEPRLAVLSNPNS